MPSYGDTWTHLRLYFLRSSVASVAVEWRFLNRRNMTMPSGIPVKFIRHKNFISQAWYSYALDDYALPSSSSLLPCHLQSVGAAEVTTPIIWTGRHSDTAGQDRNLVFVYDAEDSSPTLHEGHCGIVTSPTNAGRQDSQFNVHPRDGTHINVHPRDGTHIDE